jgi:hypothetical protein
MKLQGEPYQRSKGIKAIKHYIEENQPVEHSELRNRLSVGFSINKNTADDWIENATFSDEIENTYYGYKYEDYEIKENED